MLAAPLDPGLILVHSDRAERLRDVLVAWVRRHPLQPLETEVALVQSNGFAQWLKLALAEPPRADGSGGCGIAAAVDCRLPAQFLWQAYRAVLGDEAVPESSPFDESRLRWRLLRLLPELLDQEAYLPLRRFLSDDVDLRKAGQLAARLADLFDQYQVYRADWLEAWASGEDALIDARGGRVPLEPGQVWQACLWRALLADVAAGSDGDGLAARGGRAAVHAAFLREAAKRPESEPPPGLPRRILVFGISALPRQSLEALAMLSRWAQVLVCVNNPCQEYWADAVAQQDLLRRRQSRQQPRAGRPVPLDDTQLHLHAQPLLAAWGKQGRDFIALLDEFDAEGDRARHDQALLACGLRSNWFSDDEPDTLLSQLQNDILCLRPVAEARERWPAVDPRHDTSLSFQVAHTPQREVEILQDQLLAALDDDPTLQPRDIVVMVPDISRYAPHIRAVFGRIPRRDPRYLPFTVADQNPVGADPLLQAFEAMLGLPLERLGASQVLDWLEVPAIRASFGLEADDLPRLRQWVRQANIRWGLNDEHRSSLALPSSGEDAPLHTWRFGLRRMLLGYATGFEAPGWHGIEGYAEVSGLEAAALGQLVAFVDHLEDSWRRLREPRGVADWWALLQSWLETTFTPQDPDEGFTLGRCAAALLQWRDAALEAGLNEQQLPLSLVREAWLEGIESPGLGQRFFAGAVTFATLMPMRAIPFRHVALLGMNDGEYPRVQPAADFDLMGQDYRPGDRSRREDDRYLFLEALLSARDRLSISWVGASALDNAEQPPSVLVGQLRDHIDAVWRLDDPEADARSDHELEEDGESEDEGRLAAMAPASGDGPGVSEALTTRHPLQAFSARYVDGRDSRLYTYAAEWHRVGQAMAEEVPLEAPPADEPLGLAEVARWLRRPVEAFWQQRLQVNLHLDDPNTVDVEPFGEAGGLDGWRLRQELLSLLQRSLDAGEGPEAALELAEARVAAMRRRGDLPAASLGELAARDLVDGLAPVAQAYAEWRQAWPHAVPGDAAVAWPTASVQPWLVDRLGGLRSREPWRPGQPATEFARIVLLAGNACGKPQPSGAEISRLVPAWIEHLGAQCLAEGSVQTAVLAADGLLTWPALTADEAEQHWTALREGWEAGMQQPLPLPLRTAVTWLGWRAKAGAGTDLAQGWPAEALRLLAQAYEGGEHASGDISHDPHLHRVWPDFARWRQAVEPASFDSWAQRLLQPLIDARQNGRQSSGKEEA